MIDVKLIITDLKVVAVASLAIVLLHRTAHNVKIVLANAAVNQA